MSKRCSTSSDEYRSEYARELGYRATDAPRPRAGGAGARGRARPRRLLDRRPRAAGDLPRARHQRRRRHLGAGLLQPGDGAGRGARRRTLARRVGPGPGGGGRPGGLRRRRPRLRRSPTSSSTLIAARCVQALGGAAAVTAALELLPATVGSERRAAAIWASAGATGAALGPGGRRPAHRARLLAVDLPRPGADRARRRRCRSSPSPGTRRRPGSLEPSCAATGRPHLLANLALAMVSAAIAAALFLLVLLLIEGWRLTPIGAALVVSVMPLAALARQPPRRLGAERPRPRRGRRDPRRRRPRRAWRCCRRPRSR